MPDPAPPDECAHCGTAIPRDARACPECGADERTGWREQSIYDGLNLPGEDGHRERPAAYDPARRRVNGLKWYWSVVAALLLIIWVLWKLRLN